MKQSSILQSLTSLCLCLTLFSCSNDLDLYADYHPIPMVYCQVDPTDSFFYVTLSKSFQSKSDVMEVFENRKDLLVDDAEIVLEAWGDGYKGWETKFSLVDQGSSDPGSAQISRSIYKSVVPFNYRDPSYYGQGMGGIYDNLRLIITAPEFDQIIYSKVPIINTPIKYYPKIPITLNLYGEEYSYFEYILWDKNIERVDFICDFYYKEFTDTWTDRKAQLILKTNILVQDSLYIRLFDDSFFNKVVNKVGNNPDVAARLFKYMDFTLMVSDGYFRDYFQTYRPGLGENDHGFYSNFTYGFGLFSVNRKLTIPNMIFDRITNDSLIYGRFTKHLNFRDW